MVAFFLYDVMWFTPLATPDFLCRGLLGSEDPGADVAAMLRAVRIAIFTILHLAAVTLLGIDLSRLLHLAGIGKTLLAGALTGLTVCTIVFSTNLRITGTQMSAEPGWLPVLAGNVAAGVVMVMYIRFAQGMDPSR